MKKMNKRLGSERKEMKYKEIIVILLFALVFILFFIKGVSTDAWQYNWSVRNDSYNKTAGIYNVTPIPLDENTVAYSFVNDEGNHTYYLGTKYYVNASKTDDSGNGLSLANAKQTIGAAVTAAGNGNVAILITKGNYSLNSLSITVGSGVNNTNRWVLSGYSQDRPVIIGNMSDNIIKGTNKGNLTLQRLKIQDSRYEGIALTYGDSISLIDVWVYNTTNYVNISGDGNIHLSQTNNTHLFHVTSEHTYDHCIKIGDNNTLTIVEWSVVKECGYWAGIPNVTDGTACGFDFPSDLPQQPKYNTLRYSKASDVLFNCLQIRTQSNFSVHHNEFFNCPNVDGISGERSHSTALGAVGLAGYSYGDFYSNIIRDGPDGEGTADSTCTDCPSIGLGSTSSNINVTNIFNNIFYNLSTSMFIYGYNGDEINTTINIFSNSLYGSSNGTLVRLGTGTITPGEDSVNFSNNIIYQAGSNTADSRCVSLDADVVRSYNLYYAPNAGTGITSLSTGEINGTDPSWVTIPTSGDFTSNFTQLNSTSIAIDNGISLPSAFAFDFHNTSRPQGSAWDIGAYEYNENITYLDNCSTLNIANTYYQLNTSITNNSATGDCIMIRAGNITFDCDGYYIKSINNYSGINSNQQNTTIKNCNVSMGSGGNTNSMGIELTDAADNSTVLNNILDNNYYGLYMAAENSLIQNNTANVGNFGGNSIGIYLSSSSNNTLADNTGISNQRFGISLEVSSDNNLLINNIGISNSTYAINIVTYSNNNIFINNTGISNSDAGIYMAKCLNNNLTDNIGISNSSYGLYILNLNDTILTNNVGTSNGSSGIYFLNCLRINATSNTGKSNSSNGIRIIALNNSLLLNNTGMSNSSYGIYLESSFNNNLTSNNGTSTGTGIRLYISSNNNLTNNIGKGDNGDGIAIGVGVNNNLINNTGVSNTQLGIDIASFLNDSFFINNIGTSNGSSGIYLSSSSNNHFINNTGISNSSNGIYTESSNNNTFINNLGTSNGSSGTSVRSAEGNIFINHISIGYLTGSYGFYIRASNNTLVQDCINVSGVYEDVHIYNTANSAFNNTFLNCSYNTSKETIQGAGNTLIRQWYYRAYVNDSNENNVNNVNVTAFNSTNNYQFNLTTDGTGYTPIGQIIDYVNVGGTKNYYSNYLINATNDSSSSNHSSYNVTSSLNNLKDVFTFNLTGGAGGDTVKPDINITFPINNSNWSNVNLDINYTRSDDVALFNCWYSNDTYLINTTLSSCENVTSVVWSEGKHNVTVWANDTAGNYNFSTISFTIDTIKPDINITYPTNNTNTTNVNLDVNYTASDANLASCWYSNDSYLINLTLGTTCDNITTVTWDEGKHNVTVWANDTAGNYNFSRISFTIDTIKPDINITYPTNNSNWSNVNLDVNFTRSDNTALFNCWYSNDTYLVNISLETTCENITSVVWSEGNHNVTVWANDTAGNYNWSSVSFNVSGEICDADTYYIDYDAGDDTNNGICSNSAWKHAPGDNNATGNANSTTLNAGNTIVFKGGVIYYGRIDVDWNGSSIGYITYKSGHLLTNQWGADRAIIDGTGSSLAYSSKTTGLININSKSYIRIEGMKIQNAPNCTDGVGYGGTIAFIGDVGGNIIINDSILYNGGENGLMLQGLWTEGTGTNPSNFTLINSTISNMGEHGIQVRGGIDNLLIEGNIIHDNGKSGRNTGNGIFAGAGGTAYCTGLTLRGNTIYDNPGKGHTNIGGHNLLIEDNFMYCNDSKPQGFGMEISTEFYQAGMHTENVTIRNNIIEVNGTYEGAIRIMNVLADGFIEDVKIYNNIIIQKGDYYGIYLGVAYYDRAIRNVTIKNNYIESLYGGKMVIYTKSQNVTYGFNAQNNHYLWGSSQNSPFKWNGTINSNFTYWNTTLGFDTFNHVQKTDPLLTENYFPKIGSPLIDAGLDLSTEGFSDDKNGVSRPLDGDGNGSAEWDIGAYEYIYPGNVTTTLNYPSNNNVNNTGTDIIFNCSAVTTGITNLTNITLYGNWSGGWHTNETVNISGTSNSTTFIKNLTDGTYIWNCLAYDNDSSSDWGDSNYTLTIDSVKPDMNITFPINNTNWSVNTIDVNYTRSDANLFNCWYSNDSYLINLTLGTTCDNITTVIWGEGKHNVTVWANDTAGNENYSTISFTIDTVKPDVNITYPINNTNTTNVNLDVNFTRSDANLASCWYSNDTYSANTTLTNCGNVTTVVWSEGNHNVTVWVNDTIGNYNWSSVSFTVDTINPSLNITYPINNTNWSNVNLDVNFTRSDANLELCWYSNDTYSANTTLTNCGNVTTVVWSEGNHNVTIWINDSSSNINKTSIKFIIDTVKPNINITYPINNTNWSNVNLDVNYTASDVNLASCWYSNDTYLANTTLTNCSTNITSVVWADAKHNVTIWINDSAGNENYSRISFTIDTIAPYFTNWSNQTITTEQSLNYDINASDDGVGLENFSINWTANFSIVAGTGVLTNISSLPAGNYYINVSVNDTLKNMNSSILLVNVTSDITSPIVNLITPINGSSWTSNLSVSFIYNVSDLSSINNCSLILTGVVDQTDNSITKDTNQTFTKSLSNANYDWSVNCTDFVNNIGNSSTNRLTVNYTAVVASTIGSQPSVTSSSGQTEEVHSWDIVSPETTTIMNNFGKDSVVKEIQIEVGEETSNVKVTVTQYDEKPTEISAEKEGQVYKYFNIETRNLEETMTKSIITIQVEKDWIAETDIEKENIALFRLNEQSNKWEELLTTQTDEDDTYYYYQAEVTSFSYFVIGEKVAEEIEGTEEKPKNIFNNIVEFVKLNLVWLTIGLGIVIVLIGIVLLKKRKRIGRKGEIRIKTKKVKRKKRYLNKIRGKLKDFFRKLRKRMKQRVILRKKLKEGRKLLKIEKKIRLKYLRKQRRKRYLNKIRDGIKEKGRKNRRKK